MPHQLSTLSNARRSKRVAFANQTTRRVNQVLAAISNITVAHHLMRLPRLTQAQGIQRNHLIGTKAIMQLNHPHIPRRQPRLRQRLVGRTLAHAVADQLDAAAIEQVGRVGREALSRNHHGLGLEVWAGVEEGLRDQHGGCSAVGRWAALELGERLVDHGRRLDLLERVLILELTVWVVFAVGVVDAAYFSKVFGFGSVSVETITKKVFWLA
jgi:hypothetical protein